MSEVDEMLARASEAVEDALDLSDLDGVEAATPGALKPGRYLCAVVSVKHEQVKSGENKGQPKLVFRFKAIDPASNKPIFKHAPLYGKGRSFTKGLLAALGWTPADGKLVPSSLEGVHVYLDIVVRQDRPTDNDIASWVKYDGSSAADGNDATPV